MDAQLLRFRVSKALNEQLFPGWNVTAELIRNVPQTGQFLEVTAREQRPPCRVRRFTVTVEEIE